MTDYSVPLPEEACDSLADSFSQGPVIEKPGGGFTRSLLEEQVGRIRGVKIEVFANEHPPPHFRVKYQSSTANYRISDCFRINGSGEVLKYEKNILLWWQENKNLIIECWNKNRPGDCPVGPYREMEG